MSPSFSVVIPVHNKGRHVAAAVESALAQSCPAHEVIVVDDASTDDSAAILASIEHPALIRLRRSVPGPGGYAARNHAIGHASGDWIAFLDADDLWDADHLADIAAAIRHHPLAGCVSCRYTHVHADRRTLSATSPGLERAADAPVGFEDFLRIWLELTECPVWTGAAAFRRDVLIGAGLFPAGKASRGGDKDLWLRAAARAPFLHVPRPSADFHHEADNKVTQRTSTTTLPALVGSARALMADASPAERRLLRRLVNQQIGLYARFAFKSGRLSPDLSAGIYLPEGWRTWIMVAGIAAVPAALRRRVYDLIKPTGHKFAT